MIPRAATGDATGSGLSLRGGRHVSMDQWSVKGTEDARARVAPGRLPTGRSIWGASERRANDDPGASLGPSSARWITGESATRVPLTAPPGGDLTTASIAIYRDATRYDSSHMAPS